MDRSSKRLPSLATPSRYGVRLPTHTASEGRRQHRRHGCFRRGALVAVVLCLGASLAVLVVDSFYIIHLEGVFLPWERVEARKMALPKDPRFTNTTAEKLAAVLPVWVISLRRVPGRRSAVRLRLAEAKVPFTSITVVDAVDGRNASAVHPDELAKYLDERHQRQWRQGQKYVRDKFAVDMSHFRALQRVVDSGQPAVILEDDVVFPPGSNFYEGLAAAMRELPSDWEILYLGACHPTVGAVIGEHLAVARGAVCTWGYIPRPSFAAAVLEGAQRFPQRGKHVDLQYNNLVKRRMVAAYICKPPLVGMRKGGQYSTLAYKSRGKAEFYDKRRARKR